MDNLTSSGLQTQQAYQSALKNEEKAKRFNSFGVGCMLYALFYTFCLYHNASGITYPFFAGGTLWFFGRYTRELKSSSAEGRRTFNKYFLVVSILAAGTLNCLTDSGVLIFFNKLLMYMLLFIWLLEISHDISRWSIGANLKAICYVVFGSISRCPDPISDFYAAKMLARMRKAEPKDNTERNRIIISIAIGITISVPIVLFVVLLLGNADALFFMLLSNMFDAIFNVDMNVFENTWTLIRLIFRVIVAFCISYGIFSYCSNKERIKAIDDIASKETVRFDVYIAITINVIVALIYLVFSFIQIFGLFLGKMTLPEGYTYASYARKGFFDLMFVCLFNVVLVLCTMAYFKVTNVLRHILTVISACTYIMVASSAFRMIMYIREYKLTFLRVFVLWTLFMIAIVMAGVLKYIYDAGFKLFKYIMVTLTVGWLCFSAMHPDYWIAGYNIAQSEAAGEEPDYYYIKNSLSLDAVPAYKNTLDTGEYYNIEHTNAYQRVERYYDYRFYHKIRGVFKINFSREYAHYTFDVYKNKAVSDK